MGKLDEIRERFHKDIQSVPQEEHTPLSDRNKQNLMNLAGTSNEAVLINILMYLIREYIDELLTRNELTTAAFRRWQEFDRREFEVEDLKLRLESMQRTLEAVNKINNELRYEIAMLKAKPLTFEDVPREPVPLNQRIKVKSGEKIAYRADADAEAVLALLRQGMSKVKIAEKLGINTKTVYRRIEELKRNGIDVDEVIRKSKKKNSDHSSPELDG